MKKKSIVLSILVLSSFLVNAQKVGTNVIKFNPLGLLFGNANVAYEKALNSKNSIVIAPSFGAYTFGDYKYSSFGLGAEYRFYTKQNAPLGFYLAPGLGFASGNVKTDNSSGTVQEAKYSGIYAKGVIGRQWIWDSGFVIDLNGGISYTSYSYKDNTSSSFNNLNGSGILPSLSFSLGYNF